MLTRVKLLILEKKIYMVNEIKYISERIILEGLYKHSKSET